MEFNLETVSAIALGIGLSASAGFRVFIPLLVASLAARFDIMPLGESFAWLGSTPALISFAVASVVEVAAYYVPFIDNLLDSIATPLSVGAGTLLMTSVVPVDSEWMKWIMGFIIGGGAAATIQGGSVLTRLTSSQLTAGAGNSVVSTGEGVAATGFSVLSLFIPVIVAILLLVFIVAIFIFGYKRWTKRKKKLETADN